MCVVRGPAVGTILRGPFVSGVVVFLVASSCVVRPCGAVVLVLRGVSLCVSLMCVLEALLRAFCLCDSAQSWLLYSAAPLANHTA